MKKIIVVASGFLVLGCSMFQKPGISPTREPQQATEMYQMDITEKISSSFKSMMDEPTDAERSRRVGKFLQSHRDFFYIAQGLLTNFDEELGKLYHLKTENIELVAEDKARFVKASYEMRIAWEFSERNLHEILGVYELALTHANDPSSEYHRACEWIVTNVAKGLDRGWKNGDRSAIISLAQDLQDINHEFAASLKSQNKKAILIPSFKKYSEASSAVRAAAFQQSLKYAQQRKQTLFDSFIAKEWLEFTEKRSNLEQEELQIWSDDVARKPQALDVLYPDPAGPGQITGNRFPTNTWAVTFDDGPHPTHTAEMFKILQDNHMVGTFFWLAQNILKYPQLVNQAGQLGFNRACHSFTHPNLPTLNQAGWNHEINDALDVYEKQVGQPATFFRCPYGACGGSNSIIRQMIAKRNAMHVFWNVDSLDWQDKNPQTVFERAKKQMEVLNHGVVLFHDIHPQSVAAFKLLTGYIREKGYQVRPLPDIVTEVRGLDQYPRYTSP